MWKKQQSEGKGGVRIALSPKLNEGERKGKAREKREEKVESTGREKKKATQDKKGRRNSACVTTQRRERGVAV